MAPALPRRSVRSSLVVPAYRWCLRHRVIERRGGYRLMHALLALYPDLEWYPLSINGLPPVHLNLRDPGAQDIVLFCDPRPFEPHLQAIFRALIRPTDTVVDVGANLGMHTVLFDRLAAKVHAFEPNVEVLPNLRRTIAGLSHTELHECALADYTGTAGLVRPPADHSVAHLAEEDDPSARPVPVRRLDDVVDRADFIKVDVEGAEALVFAGARRLLDNENGPILVFEELRRTDTARQCLETLLAPRYRYWSISREGEIRPWAPSRPDFCDILAVPAARMSFLKMALPSVV